MTTPTPALDEHQVLDLVAAEYDLGTPTSASLLQAHWNDTYEIRVGAVSYAFRLRGPNNWWIAGESDIRFEVDLLDHLAAHQVPVSSAVPRRDGDTVGAVATSAGTRLYSLFTWAPGRPGGRNSEGAREVGRTLARIHLAADTFNTSHHRYRLDEKTMLDRRLPGLEEAFTTDAPEHADYIREQIVEIRDQLRTFQPGPGGWGIIHGDVQELNFHIDSGQVTFFDFDLCAWGWRTSDIAEYYTRIPPPRRQPFLDGYQSLRPLNPGERDMLLTIARLAWIREGVQGAALVRRLIDPFMSFQPDDTGRWQVVTKA